MKKILLFVCVFAAAAGMTLVTAAASVPIESNAQYEAQISFFKSALDEFGATDPNEAVRLWVKGDEMRNGVFKYAVAGEKLKKQLLGQWGAPEKYFWIIGTSSPWLSGYDIESRVSVSPSEIKYTVRYYWQTSAGSEMPTVEKLFVTKDKELWRISRVIPLSGG